MGRCVLRRLIWGYTVCLSPTKRDTRLKWVNIITILQGCEKMRGTNFCFQYPLLPKILRLRPASLVLFVSSGLPLPHPTGKLHHTSYSILIHLILRMKAGARSSKMVRSDSQFDSHVTDLCWPKIMYVSRLVGKPTMWFLTRSDTNWPVQAQKQARSLKLCS